ncbi:tRNA dihydrouridine(20/20a) synthase DusA [Psychrosphaera saromensis]|uniref:tRNA-dihydrouridine(20/20a) synthase n=1 Tax=Psychrosphaera saromensis TaxID=716813 RepID=A0A2S7USX4_9GAMM|nr:tRNA dihydrouridine(20/20a) synthase DusA [Psychrosphaera saromensis]PQJ53043.1 tRNA dihydrouridine(20/20a) synthase DusA [Psychrosphaera saromensis]
MSTKTIDRRFCVAPMLDWTDRHCRYFYRLMSKNTVLYTEMVTTGAIIHGKGDYLKFNSEEQPVALQLGGSDPVALAHCAKLAEERGYDEVNLNVGCPSDRVQNGMFGACLMAKPELVAECVKAMKEVTSIPITVKSRIGIDDFDSFEFLADFIKIVKEAGCTTFIIHARKAWLTGLSPKQNRDVPPLDYDRVYKIKQMFPELEIIINGGIKTLEESVEHLKYVDGVMLGREIYQNPYILADVDKVIYQEPDFSPLSRVEVMNKLASYITKHESEDGKAWHVLRHIMGLFQGLPGAKIWRRNLSENAVRSEKSGAELMEDASSFFRQSENN